MVWWQRLKVDLGWIDACMAASAIAMAPSTVLAWGNEGHQVVALIAEKHLTAQAHAQIEQLLALEPGQTLASISIWADEHRSPQMAPMHYVNFPRGDCHYQETRDCPDGKCVVSAIERNQKILQSDAPPEKRLVALKYLVHFVADVHQPLHAGYADDRGGNTYQLQAFMRGSNLHAVWDTGLIRQLAEKPETLAQRLESRASGFAGHLWTPASAAEESCVIVGLKGFYPDRLVNVAYITHFTPIAEVRLITADVRLAELLNSVLDTK